MGADQSHPAHIREALAAFSDSLVPSEEYFRKGNTIGNKVFNFLQKNRRDVARVLIAGGIGKRTAVSERDDFDLVILLNYQEPPFDAVLNEIEGALTSEPLDSFGTKCQNVSIINETTLRFLVDNIKFDLSIGVNFTGWFSYNQRNCVLDKIQKMDHPVKHGHLYSPSLAEYAVTYVKEKSAFEHAAIRLAKYWNRNVSIGNYIAGRSLLIEMVAFEACRQVKNNDIFLVMIKFFELMEEPRNLNICCSEDHHFIPLEILSQRPLVLDPINPYNNLARCLTGNQVNSFSWAANTALERLKNWKEYTPLCADFVLGSGNNCKHELHRRNEPEIQKRGRKPA